MIYFVEINKTDHDHEMINSCMLKMFQIIYDEKSELTFWGSKSHFNNLKIFKNLKLSLNFLNVRNQKDGNKVSWLFKYLTEIQNLIRVSISAKRENVDLIFFASLSPIGHFFLTCMRFLWTKNIPIILTLHGDLEFVKNNPQLSFVNRMYGFCIKKGLKWDKFKTRYLILGEAIKEGVIEHGFIKKNKIICIEHPYVFDTGNVSSSKIEYPIKFGHIGIAKKDKNSQLFFSLAKNLKNYIEDKKANFEVIGRVFGLDTYLNEFVKYSDIKVFLSRNEFQNKLETINFAIFFYDNSNYEFIGSGAVMDAIANGIPIIAMSNRYFSKLFLRNTENPIGWLCSDFKNLNSLVISIIEHFEKVDYAKMSQNVLGLQKNYSIKHLTPLFEEQIKDFIYETSESRVL